MTAIIRTVNTKTRTRKKTRTRARTRTKTGRRTRARTGTGQGSVQGTVAVVVIETTAEIGTIVDVDPPVALIGIAIEAWEEIECGVIVQGIVDGGETEVDGTWEEGDMTEEGGGGIETGLGIGEIEKETTCAGGVGRSLCDVMH